MKKLLTVLIILTVSGLYSQNITLEITAEQAKKAIKNAQRVEVLTEQLQIQEIIISNQNESIETLRQKLLAEELKFSLLQNNYNIVNTQYRIEKGGKNKGKWLQKFLVITGVFGLGYITGSL